MPVEGARARLKAWAELLSRRGQAFSIFRTSPGEGSTWKTIGVEGRRQCHASERIHSPGRGNWMPDVENCSASEQRVDGGRGREKGNRGGRWI